MKRVLALVMAAAFSICALAGCGAKLPTEKDAKDYVKAVLDVMCTGDYDHSVKLADVEEGKESEMRDAAIDEVMTQLGEENGMTEETKAAFREVLIKAFGKAKYTVGEATKTGDGEYDVAVSVEPLRIFEGAQDKLYAKVEERREELSALSADEINNEVMLMLVDILGENLEAPTYDPAEEVVVHYGLLDEKEKLYGCSEEDGQKVGEKLFSQEGF